MAEDYDKDDGVVVHDVSVSMEALKKGNPMKNKKEVKKGKNNPKASNRKRVFIYRTIELNMSVAEVRAGKRPRERRYEAVGKKVPNTVLLKDFNEAFGTKHKAADVVCELMCIIEG